MHHRRLFAVCLVALAVLAPVQPSAAARPTIRRGATGPAVRELQTLLNGWIGVTPTANLKPLPVDGVFGATTDTTVRTFQRMHRLAADGIVGPKTWSALDAANTLVMVTIRYKVSGTLDQANGKVRPLDKAEVLYTNRQGKGERRIVTTPWQMEISVPAGTPVFLTGQSMYGDVGGIAIGCAITNQDRVLDSHWEQGLPSTAACSTVATLP